MTADRRATQGARDASCTADGGIVAAIIRAAPTAAALYTPPPPPRPTNEGPVSSPATQ
ncbi:hypothetical protein [Streptomyces sp. KR80]|uniref:hypothetical protein n=1 Tax=Streptomyces sp. KR80 TaxID=3457426 RepID=UPI003FCF7A25